MENTFLFYFRFGLGHILDWAALDHILFLVVLCAVYTLRDWRKVLVLITAFTIGHCASLLLAGMDWLRLSSIWVETLIPASIAVTAIYNLWQQQREDGLHIYTIALVFGLIHGLGFSNTFRAMLFDEEQAKLLWYLLAFNLGVEVGQLIIVLIILGLSYLALECLKIGIRWWNWSLNIIALVIAGWMIVERLL